MGEARDDGADWGDPPENHPYDLSFWEEGPDGRRHVLVPDIEDGSKIAEVVRWIASPGDAVEILQPLAEVMYDRATVEVHSPLKGVLDETDAQKGDEVEIGSILCRLRAAGG